MNKTLKNFLMISLLVITTVVVSYFTTSCCMVFNQYEYDVNDFKNSYFQDRDGNILFRFTKTERVFVFSGNDNPLSLTMIDKGFKHIDLVDDEKVVYELYAIDEGTLYVNNGNYYVFKSYYEDFSWQIA